MHPRYPFGPGFFFPSLQFGVFLALIGGVIAFSLAVHVVVCALLYGCYSRIPRQFRKQEPGLVWLLLIPCFNLVWNFFLYSQLADSYKAYFASVGRTDLGDCGKSIGLAYAICAACCAIPCLNWLAGLAALVLLILYLVKAMDLKSQIPPQSGS
jgi:hypothetical protein